MEEYVSQADKKQIEQLEKHRKNIESLLLERRKQREFVLKQLQVFCDGLFGAIITVVEEVRALGVTELGKPRLIDHPAGTGKALNIPIEDWSVILVPLAGVARPNIKDEAQIPGNAFRELSGRIAAFIGSEPDSVAFYDILILQNGSWFAWGYGWPRQASTVGETNFKMLAYELVASFVKDIRTTWHSRDETLLGVSMDARKRPYDFGLPGDEAGGGR